MKHLSLLNVYLILPASLKGRKTGLKITLQALLTEDYRLISAEPS
jgi:hypothetical protein